mmetsp:Transcript_29094/g.60854  ORF Transcript_29094/g.60854 Transcript_29094/m.60854 type:complete len:175 (-) Transcript_29094:205-729(-)
MSQQLPPTVETTNLLSTADSSDSTRLRYTMPRQVDEMHIAHINATILLVLVITCMFFSFYDIVKEGIIWSTLGIYVPCGVLFYFGTMAWARLIRQRKGGEMNPKAASQVLVFGNIMAVVTFGLVTYGFYLMCVASIMWAWATLMFGAMTAVLTYSSCHVQTEEEENVIFAEGEG